MKILKKITALFLVLLMVLSFSACEKEKEKEKEPVSSSPASVTSEQTEKPQSEPIKNESEKEEFSPVSAELGDYTVVVVGAEYFKDVDDKDAIRIYYDFTNNADTTESAFTVLDLTAEQDGYEINTTYASYDDDVAEYNHDSLGLRPGCSIRCVEEFALKLDGGTFNLTIADFWNEENSLEVSFDPQNLPGAPTDVFEIKTISDPQWTLDYPDGGVYDTDYEIYILDDADVVQNYDGEDVIRVYFDYTNNSKEAGSLWWISTIRAYQDGVELEVGYPSESVEEDENYNVDLEPGKTITAAKSFILRSDSPVEIEINDFMNSSSIGCVFKFE